MGAGGGLRATSPRLLLPRRLPTFDAVDWKVSFVSPVSSFIMSLNHFGLRIKCSCLRIYEELVRKEFSFKLSRNCDSIEARSSVLCS